MLENNKWVSILLLLFIILKSNAPIMARPLASYQLNLLFIEHIDSLKPGTTGEIADEQGKPLPGVSIQVKGTAIGVTTDENGKFRIDTVTDNAILVISALNINRKEIRIGGKKNLGTIIVKTKVSQLGVVTIKANTGYQLINPNETNGAINIIDNKTLNQQTGTNILKRLDGMTTSILFDTKNIQAQKKSNITVRGLSSINGPLDPLIVLDGFIYDGDVNNLDPNLIDNITILKDAAAASIWGARAGNGVIVISTKKGKLNQKLNVDFNSTVTINSKPNLSYMPQMSSSDYINAEQLLFGKGYFTGQFTNRNHPPITPAVEVFEKRAMGEISASDSADLIDRLKTVDVRKEYNQYFYTNAVTQQYSINMNGGNTNNSYALSIGYNKGIGELYESSRKLNISLNNIYHPNKKIQISANIYYTNSKNISGKPSYNSVTIGGRQVPYLTFDNNIDLSLRGAYTDTVGGGKLLNWKYYPLEDYRHDKIANTTNDLFSIFGLQYKPLSFLSIDLQYQYEQQQSIQREYADTGSYKARNLINLFSQLDRVNDITKYIIPFGGILSTNNGNTISQTGRVQLNFNNAWKMNAITAIVGAETRQINYSSATNTTYGYINDPLLYSNVDFTNRYPTIITGANQTIPGAPTFGNIENRFISLYTNISYIFKKQYSLSLSARKDGSNIFGVNTNDKWKPLWSSAIGWSIANEKFYHLNFLPFLRLRASYGFSGNVDLTKSSVPIQTYIGTNALTGYQIGRITTLNNPNLRWEKVGTINLGIDFSTINETVAGSIDYYRKNGNDLYAPTPYDYTTYGLSPTIIKNVASMKGNGLELNIKTINTNKRIFWSTRTIFNYQSNKTTNYYSPTSNSSSTHLSQLLGAGKSITPVVGKPLYAIAAYKWGGLDAAGNPQGYLNGKLSIDYNALANTRLSNDTNSPITYVGSALPTIFGSVINTFQWKSFTLSLNVSYEFGYYFIRPALSYLSLINNGIGNKEYSKRWQKPGDEKTTNVPSFVYPDISGRDAFYNNAIINVLKGGNIRLKYVNLEYHFDGEGAKDHLFNRLSIYVNAANLGILWRANKEMLDPDYPFVAPPVKSWALGLNVAF